MTSILVERFRGQRHDEPGCARDIGQFREAHLHLAHGQHGRYLSVTGAQSISDSAAIAKIISSYKETVTADVNTTETLAGTGTLNTLSFSNATQGINANLASGSATTVAQ